MIILGLDCSSKQSSVCIQKDGKTLYTAVQATAVNHSQNLLTMVKHAMDICQITPADITLYAVTKGPGSFTGLRIGMAAVKGMASVRNTPCIGVSSLQALAACCDLPGRVIPSFDARRGQVYACVTDEGEVVLADFCENVTFLENYVKNSPLPVYFVGDGKNICYNTYKDYPHVRESGIDMPCIALGACRLGAKIREKGAGTHFDLTPSYLRLSQAEREMKEKLEAKK